MRKLRKYRGLTKDKKWAYGYAFYLDRKYYIIHQNAILQSRDSNFKLVLDEPHNFIEVIPETVGQSIVVEGKEYYEGDVTKDDTGDIGIVRFGKLPLDKSGDCVCSFPAFYIQCLGQLGHAPTYDCQEIGKWWEIIGTIHTHPELLKGEQDNG